MKTFPIIYKRTSTGATQQWQQELNPDNLAQYRTISGQVDGKLVYSEWKTAETTNEGRSNERNPLAQALFEIEANYKKKLDKDYHKNVDNIDKAKVFAPMLAKEYGKVKFNFPVYTQPKLDGMRCIATKDGLFSRNGKEILSCPHIFEVLKPLFEQDENLIFDGELYNHDFKDDFNSIISNARKLKPTPEQLEESAKLIEYHIYDIPSMQENFKERIATLTLNDVAQQFGYGYSKKVKIVTTNYAHSQEDLDTIYAEYLEQGYEGQMVRLDEPYENKRSKSLLKRKESKDAEFILVDIEEGKGNYAGIAKRATLRMEDGREFGAGITGTQEFNKKLLQEKDQYIGTPTTVVFFDYTPDGIPRFGRVKEFNRTDNE